TAPPRPGGVGALGVRRGRRRRVRRPARVLAGACLGRSRVRPGGVGTVRGGRRAGAGNLAPSLPHPGGSRRAARGPPAVRRGGGRAPRTPVRGRMPPQATPVRPPQPVR